MYDVDVTPEHLTISLDGEVLLRLSQGLALTIGLTYGHLQRQAVPRAQDFIHGVLLGLNHVALTGVLPTVVPLPLESRG